MITLLHSFVMVLATELRETRPQPERRLSAEKEHLRAILTAESLAQWLRDVDAVGATTEKAGVMTVAEFHGLCGWNGVKSGAVVPP